MDRPASPSVSASASVSDLLDDTAPPSPSSAAPSPQVSEAAAVEARKKKSRKKRKPLPGEETSPGDTNDGTPRKAGPKKKKRKDKAGEEGAARKKVRKQTKKSQFVGPVGVEELTPAQLAANEQMRKVLEEDKYSAVGSIVDTESEGEDSAHARGGRRLDRAALLAAARKRLWMERISGSALLSGQDEEVNEVDNDDAASRSSCNGRTKKKRKKGSRRNREDEAAVSGPGSEYDDVTADEAGSELGIDEPREMDVEHDGASIFGATTGASNATWVECDKCKKWRRLRGVVDEKKLPSKWYCSMNKNDPERARCSASEEEYETANTPESQADARIRKHLRIWVRRLQCNEAYESRQPTMTRGKKRSAMTNSKEPYEWVRCCNPSCGKWRAVLRCMDAKTNVLDRTAGGIWFCVMNTWDEKIASCAAPQENLPAIGCPPWVMQDEN